VENEMEIIESTVKSLRSLAKEKRDRYVEATFSFAKLQVFCSFFSNISGISLFGVTNEKIVK